MITVNFDERGDRGLCEYLYSSIKNQILQGILRADEKLPSKRSLASHLGISVITVQNAYGQLISEGYIYSIEKKGFFVTDILLGKSDSVFGGTGNGNLWGQGMSVNSVSADDLVDDSKTLAPVNSIGESDFFTDFRSNSTSYEKFPFSLWAHTMRKVLNSGDEKLLQRVGVKGIYELRRSIADYLREFRNMNVKPEQLVIGAGTESLYSMVVQLLGQGKVYAVENPGYHKVAGVFKMNGAGTKPVMIDSQGINPAGLEKIKADVVHVSPAHHFPTGIVMPVRRRQELLAWADGAPDRFIIEDDYDSEFRFNGKPLPTLQSADMGGRVIYINSFSKTLAPSFRMSYMVLPENLLPDFDEKFGFYSCPVSAFEQYTLSEFIRDGFYGKHIIRMKNFYRNLRNELIRALENSRISGKMIIKEEEAGLHFLLSVKSDESSDVIKNKLQKKNINLPLLRDFYYGTPPDDIENIFVINYSGIRKERIAETVKRIEEVLL
ncbi:MAG: PLP-dependent aminotransferase family protein [Treponema sp.]|nr:PLP-dependent aminotransferase family protein [Treponema sp.]